MNRLPNALIDELVDDLEPVRPMKLAHGIGLVALAALVTIGLVELLDGLWRGILAGEASAYYFIANGMLGLLGAAAYMVTYPAWKSSGLLDAIAGGKVTLGTVPAAKYEGLTALPGDILGIVLGLAFIVIAFVLPDSLNGKTAEPVPAQ